MKPAGVEPGPNVWNNTSLRAELKTKRLDGVQLLQIIIGIWRRAFIPHFPPRTVGSKRRDEVKNQEQAAAAGDRWTISPLLLPPAPAPVVTAGSGRGIHQRR